MSSTECQHGLRHRLRLRTPIHAIVIAVLGCLAAVVLGGCQSAIWPGLFGLTEIPVGDYSYAIERTDRSIRRLMRRKDIPAVAVALIDDQSVVWHHAYGVANLETGSPATVDTVFKAGSIAKVFTGLEVMRMYEDGLIDIDAPVTTYLPEFRVGALSPDPESITVRSMLSHRSGLPRNGSHLLWQWETVPYVLEAHVDSAAEVHQVYPVGVRYKYSNLAFEVLGRMVEVVRQAPVPGPNTAGAFPYFMQEQWLDPLGMTSTGFGSRALLYGDTGEADVAVGYHNEGRRTVAYPQYDIVNLASGNLYTTLTDMERFVSFVLAGGIAGGNRRISEQTLALMFESQQSSSVDPQTNGLAWFTDRVQLSDLAVFHSGTNQGFISMVALVPSHDVGLVLLGNAEEFEDDLNQLTFDTLRLLMGTKIGLVPPEPAQPPAVEIPAARLHDYAGSYVIEGEIADVSVGSSGLVAEYRGVTFRLEAISQARFRFVTSVMGMDDVMLSFFPSASPEENLMIVTLGGSYHITCPAYPVQEVVPDLWAEVEGSYDLFPRHPSPYGESGSMGTDEIAISNGVLLTSSGKALVPVNESVVRIVGGVFDGEVMERDPATGSMIWQNLEYVPSE